MNCPIMCAGERPLDLDARGARVTTSIQVRLEAQTDHSSISSLVEAAFPSPAEARLVETLRMAGQLAVSLVAVSGSAIVGHIAFSPVYVDTPSGPVPGLGLAPVSVAPPCQGQGIGSLLVRTGIQQCRTLSAGYLVVLGSPGYYRRFGFAAASRWGLGNEYGATDGFMALELAPSGIPRGGGLVRYAPPLALVG